MASEDATPNFSMEDLQDFWKYLTHLNEVISEVFRCESREELIREMLPGLVRRDGALGMLLYHKKKGLGLVGGAFGVAHDSLQHFVLLQNSEFPHSTGQVLPHIDLDYKLTGKPEEVKAEDVDVDLGFAIDLLWRGRRGMQPLPGDPPEFLSHLGHCLTASLPLITDKRLRDQYKKGADVLYCPADEVGFWVYVWRWLVRCKVLDVRPLDTLQAGDALSDPLAEKRCPAELWAKPVWGSGVPESLLCSVGDIARDLLGEASAQSHDAHTRAQKAVGSALRGWKRLGKLAGDGLCLNGPEADAFDWEAMGCGEVRCKLDEKENPSPKILAYARRFAQNLADLRSAFLVQPSKSCDTIGIATEDVKEHFNGKVLITTHELSRADECLDRAGAALQNGDTELFLKNLTSAVRSLAYVLLASLKADSLEEQSVDILLNTFHQVVRFPAPQVFYICVARRSPVQHIVLPVWESARHQLTLKLPDRVRRKARDPSDGEESKLPAVVFALIELAPCWELGVDTPGSSFILDPWYRGRLDTVLRRLAKPIVDMGFYGGPVERSTRKSAAGAATEEAARMFAHQIAKIGSKVDRWLVTPERWQAICDTFGGDERWKSCLDGRLIAVAPDLQQALGRTLKLWSMTIDPEELFPDGTPDDLGGLARVAWELASDARFLRDSVAFGFDTSVRDVEKAWQWPRVNKRPLEALEKSSLDAWSLNEEGLRPHNPQLVVDRGNREACKQVSGILRFLVAAIGDYSRHADEAETLTVSLSEDDGDTGQLQLSCVNKDPRDRRTAGSPRLHVGLAGRQVYGALCNRYLRQLNARVEFPPLPDVHCVQLIMDRPQWLSDKK